MKKVSLKGVFSVLPPCQECGKEATVAVIWDFGADFLCNEHTPKEGKLLSWNDLSDEEKELVHFAKELLYAKLDDEDFLKEDWELESRRVKFFPYWGE